MERGYILHLDHDEENIAQLLTRDAWVHFRRSGRRTNKDKLSEIPPMPHSGVFEVPKDPEIVSHFLSASDTYFDELAAMGWNAPRFVRAKEGFTKKLERASGARRPSVEESDLIA
jgi:hypothetical protein